MQTVVRWIISGSLLAAGSFPGAAVAQVFRDRVDVAALGLRIPVFAGARTEVLPMPEVLQTKADRKDVYKFRDLWYRTEWVGEWSAGGGSARLRLARPSWLAPADLMDQYVLAEKFNEVRATARPPASPEEMIQWLGAFTKGRANGPKPVVQPFLQLAEAVRYDLDLDGPAALAYAFRMKPNPYGVPTNQWYVVIAESKSADTTRLATAMEQEWLRAVVAVAPPKSGGAPTQEASGERAAGMAGQDSNREASRLAALRSVEGQKGWWSLSGSNYVIVTSVKPTQRKFVEEVLQQLETLRTLWQTIAPPERPIEVVSVVRMFGHRDEYESYAGEAGKNTGGMWDPVKRELCISPSEHLVGSEQRKWLAEVLYHEGLHQYFFYAYPKGATPAWYNEGHATLMEGVQFEKTGVEIGEVERYVQLVDDRIRKGNSLRFARLIRMSYPEFYAPQREQRAHNYATAWALIYYLRKGAPVAGEEGDAAILERFHQVMLATGNAKEATDAAFDGVDLDQLEQRFLIFWNRARLRSQARKFLVGVPAQESRNPSRSRLEPSFK